MLRSMIHCVGKGSAIGVVIACCTPTTGGGTPGTASPAKQTNKLCEHKSDKAKTLFLTES